MLNLRVAGSRGVHGSREQMTGLSDALRARTVTVSENGAVTTVVRSFDPATKTETTTVWRDGGTPVIRSTKFGALVETHSLADRIVSYFDAFLTPYHVRTFHPVTGALRSRRFLDMDEATWDPVYTETWYGSLKVTGESQFDAFGRETVRIDALGNAVTNAFDALGRRVSAFGATYPVTHGYDTAGRRTVLSTTRDGGFWDRTAWLYNVASGLVTNKVYADGSRIGYTHTADSRPVRTTWARGEWRENSYTADGLLSGVEYSDATPDVSLSYDTHQYPVVASNAVALFAYLNSALGTATNEMAIIGGGAFTLTRRLDDRQRLVAISFDGQLHATYSYDAENRLAVVSNDAFTVAYAYTADGHDAGWTLAATNGAVISRALTRDSYRRGLVTLITNWVNGTPLTPLNYTHDALDRITARNSDTFGYNSRSEIISTDIQSTASRYAYDCIGNNLLTSCNATTNTYTANALNQYTSIDATTLAYDGDGNLITNGLWSYTWDCDNRLTAVFSNSVCVVSNAYDHAYRRVLKVTPATTCTYLYDGWNLIWETVQTSQSTVTNRFVWGRDLSGSLQGAGGIGGLLAVQVGGAWYFPFYDNNGNVTAYVNEQGAVVAEYLYDAFGRTLTATGPLVDSFRHRFSTKYYDAESGLYYYGYRFYGPELLRWLNRDPIEEEGGINLYMNCINNLLERRDALGLWTITRQSDQSWAEARAEEGDSFQSLSDLIRLNFDERTKWIKLKGNSFVSESDEAIKDCIYHIPNVMAVYTSKSGWGDGIITFVTHLKRIAISDGNRYRAKGYKVIENRWAASDDAFIDLWTLDGLAAISFAGHGTKYGFKPDKDSGYAVNPSEVSPKYKLQAVRAYSCLSDSSIPGNIMLPDGTTPSHQWRGHISKKGSYVGFTGLVNWLSQLWQERPINADIIPD